MDLLLERFEFFKLLTLRRFHLVEPAQIPRHASRIISIIMVTTMMGPREGWRRPGPCPRKHVRGAGPHKDARRRQARLHDV